MDPGLCLRAGRGVHSAVYLARTAERCSAEISDVIRRGDLGALLGRLVAHHFQLCGDAAEQSELELGYFCVSVYVDQAGEQCQTLLWLR